MADQMRLPVVPVGGLHEVSQEVRGRLGRGSFPPACARRRGGYGLAAPLRRCGFCGLRRYAPQHV
eukprot:15450676-Alexandrium_andersonii.AAC.1